MSNDTFKKKYGTGIRISEMAKEFLDERGLGVQRAFEVGLSALKLSVQCPLASTCIYLNKTEKKISRSDLPCERGGAVDAQQERPIGWKLCPVRAAFIGQKYNDIPWPGEPGQSSIDQ